MQLSTVPLWLYSLKQNYLLHQNLHVILNLLGRLAIFRLIICTINEVSIHTSVATSVDSNFRMIHATKINPGHEYHLTN